MEKLAEVVGEAVVAGPSYFSDPEKLRGLHHHLGILSALEIQAIGEFDQWDAGAADGAKNAASWLSHEFKEPVKESRRRVKSGRALRDLPIVAEAFADGKINRSHLDLIVGARNPRTEDAITKDQEYLVQQAIKSDFEDFARDLEYVKQSADPDGVEEEAAAQRARRDAYLEPVAGGMFFGKLIFDPISGTIVTDELHRLEQVEFEADWAEAKERLGRDPLVSDLRRTAGQRRADAFVEMATRSRTVPANGRRPAPLFTALVGLPVLEGRMCELANGLVVTPGSLLPWLDQAYIERAVFEPDGRVEVSESARFFTGATRRALEVRDRRCTHPYCNEPVERCQGDHIKLASEGGPTTQENGRLLCAFHNRLRNQRPPPDG